MNSQSALIGAAGRAGVSCQWTVDGRRSWDGEQSSAICARPRIVRGQLARLVTDRFEVVVELGAKLIEQRFQSPDVGIVEKLPSISAAQEMFGFVERTSRGANESAVVSIAASTFSFGKVGADTVRGSNQLLADCIPGEVIPNADELPYPVRDLFGQLLDPQPFEIRPHGALSLSRSFPPVEHRQPRTTDMMPKPNGRLETHKYAIALEPQTAADN